VALAMMDEQRHAIAVVVMAEAVIDMAQPEEEVVFLTHPTYHHNNSGFVGKHYIVVAI
jgi:hypothetical protein